MDMKNFIFDLQRFESAFSGGGGTESNPYLISSVADLQQLATDVNGGNSYSGKYFKLANDIDLSTVSNFTPIGKYEDIKDYYFSGTFDGGNYTISNLKINNTSSNYQGLFGYINGTVKNVTVKDATVSGGSYVGAVVGSNNGMVSNCYVLSVTVSGSNRLGAVVGYNGGTVSNCYYYILLPLAAIRKFTSSRCRAALLQAALMSLLLAMILTRRKTQSLP